MKGTITHGRMITSLEFYVLLLFPLKSQKLLYGAVIIFLCPSYTP